MTTIRTKMATVICTLLGLTFILGGCATSSRPADSWGPASSSELVAIDLISTSQTRDGTHATIEADGPLTFSSFKKPDPLAVVLIFPETTSSLMSDQPVLDSDLIRQVIVTDGNGGRTTRVEFQLTADASYTATQKSNNVWLEFKPVVANSSKPDSDEGSSMPPSQAPVVAQAPAAAPATSAMQPRSTAAAPVNVPGTTAWVNKVDFLSEAEGKSTLVLGTTHVVNYKIHKLGLKKLEVELLNTRIPSYRQRALITTRFTSAVDRIVPYQVSAKKNETRVSIEMREAVPYYAEQVDNMLLIHFEASSVPPKPMEQAQLPAWKQSMSGDTGGMMGPGPSASMPAAAPIAPSFRERPMTEQQELEGLEQALMEDDREIRAMLAPRRKNYTGEKIALDFYDTDIKNVFRILREVSGKNFAIDKDVAGKVTMTLDKPVPWDQVLDLVLRMNQLGMAHEGEIVRIATLETLKKEDDLRRSKMEALRKARDEAKALEPLVTRYIPISYSNADAEIKPHIENILTPGRGSVTVDGKNNQIIVTDTAPKVKQAEVIVRRIDKVTAQVIIEAKVVEVSKDFSKELGVDWTLNYGPGIIPGTGINTNTDLAMNLPSQSSSSIGLSFSRLSGVPWVLNARLNALETTGEGKILSSPKILTLDNKKAKIKQGLEFAYLERDSSGGSSVKFKNIDLLLEVTPHVTPDDRISLIIFITKNDVAGITAGVPNVATNEAETELLVNDGDTVVIGGIVKRTQNKGTTAFPGLSKIPVLGWAFRSNTNVTADDELLIFITPRIVQLEQQVGKNVN